MHLAAALVLAVSIQVTNAALQASLPEFKSKREFAAAQAVNASAVENKATFYTGKPFEAQREGYLFKYRNFDSELSRWTSADPSGFPDGSNNLIYAPSPLSQLDSTGLETVDVTWTPHSGPSGGIFSFTVSPPDAHPLTPSASMILSLNVNSSYSGWIVQHVTFDLTAVYNDSDNTQYTIPGYNTSYDYWEAWQVTNGSIGIGSTDTFSLNFPSSTHGTASITGNINFFQSSAFTNLTGNNNPANWGTHLSGAKPAGDLNATTTEPSFWADSGYNHNMNMTWE